MPQPGEFVLTKNAPKEPVIIIDDDNEDDSPVEYVEPPVREHKALGVPNVIFPADLPISIVKMIRTYQIKHNCTAIYCCQVPRIFSIPEKGDRPARPVEYVWAMTGEKLFVRALTLDWMKREAKPKNSERLLVASGGPLTEPIVLARMKAFSGDYRAWGGVYDDPTAQPTVVRKVVSDALIGDEAGRRLSLTNATTNTEEVPSSAKPGGKRREKRRASAPQPQAQDARRPKSESIEATIARIPPAPPVLHAHPHPLAPPHHQSDAATIHKATHTAFHFYATPPTFSPQAAADATIIPARTRLAIHCQTHHTLFMNALASGVICEKNDRFPVLECEVTTTWGRKWKLVVADGVDFMELVRVILAEESWGGAEEGCVVAVRRFAGV